jgi:hypothetical protein
MAGALLRDPPLRIAGARPELPEEPRGAPFTPLFEPREEGAGLIVPDDPRGRWAVPPLTVPLEPPRVFDAGARTPLDEREPVRPCAPTVLLLPRFIPETLVLTRGVA